MSGIVEIMRRLPAGIFGESTRIIEKMPAVARQVFAMVAQVAFVLLANMVAFVLRFEARIPPDYWELALRGLPLVTIIYGAGLLAFGIHRGLWRYVGFHDLKVILNAGIVSTGAFYLSLHGVLGWVAYPRSVIIMTGLLSVVFLGGIRIAVRIFREWSAVAGPIMKRLMIVGAGNAGEMLARDLKMNPEYRYEPVVFVDDNPVKQKRTIHGVPVGGTIEDIPGLVRRHAVKEIIVAVPSASPTLMQRVLAASATCHVPIKTLPTVRQILDSPVSIRQARPMRLDDLLQREPIETDLQELHPLLEGRRILVTGAGGSIGSELCRQIIRYRPATLVLFERYENSLHALELELRESFPQAGIRAVVGDVTDADGVKAVFRACTPHLIFHAAAHKHVPLMEHNQREAVRNNVLGTRVVTSAARGANVERFVLISTDKAVNPTNVMGATKRVAEYTVQAMNGAGSTRFTVVRFGNVLGSNGSVVPLFADQIKKGGPITVTHPDIKRFFMTIPEAVQLILQASVRSQGGDVFVLDMGEQVRITDLARNMIVLSGLVPDQDIKITYSGLRPGEKLYEELFERDERVEPTSHAKIKRVVGGNLFEVNELARRLDRLEESLSRPDQVALVSQLKELVPTYVPSEKG
jgi:FlaA1/EpsC-like NDP-sugar epimerase